MFCSRYLDLIVCLRIFFMPEVELYWKADHREVLWVETEITWKGWKKMSPSHCPSKLELFQPVASFCLPLSPPWSSASNQTPFPARRSCKICASCVNFSRKQHIFLQNLQDLHSTSMILHWNWWNFTHSILTKITGITQQQHNSKHEHKNTQIQIWIRLQIQT